MIPKCQFSANVVLKEEDEVPPLQHRVRLIGSKSPFNSFMFEINPPGKCKDTFTVIMNNCTLFYVYIIIYIHVRRVSEHIAA